MELLSVANIDVNQSNKHGESGVHIAAGLGRLEMLKVLLSHGANLGAVDSAGDSGVSWAARQGHSAVLQFLVEQGVHVNQQNKVITVILLLLTTSMFYTFTFTFILFLFFIYFVFVLLAGRGLPAHWV